MKVSTNQKNGIQQIVEKHLTIPPELFNIKFVEEWSGDIQEIGVDWVGGKSIAAINFMEEFNKAGSKNKGTLFTWFREPKYQKFIESVMKSIHADINQILF